MTGWCRTCPRRTKKSADQCAWCKARARVVTSHGPRDLSAVEIERRFQVAKAWLAYRRHQETV